MYHIKHDKRAYASAELIYQGLCQCIRQKDFARITIHDIEQASSVSRSTFYRHFDTIPDVLYWRCSQCLCQLWEQYLPAQPIGKYDFLRYFLDYWAKHIEILELLLTVNRTDIIYTCHVEQFARFQEKYAAFTQLPAQYSDYFMSMRAGILVGVLTTWLQRGKQESVDELFAIAQMQFDFLQQTELVF